MSLFGFEQKDLEKEKHHFLGGHLRVTEDLHVYALNEQGYDGLGDSLQEGGDELNDETFGDTGAVGKDFDFTQNALPLDDRSLPHSPGSPEDPVPRHFSPFKEPEISPSSHSPQHSLEAIWDEKSPFSLLSRANGNPDRLSEHRQISNAPTFSPFQNDDPSSINYPLPSGHLNFSPFQADGSPSTTYQQLAAHGNTLSGLWPLQETEAELRVVSQNQAFTLAEMQRHQQELIRLQQQQLLLQQEQLRHEQLRQEQIRQEQIRQEQRMQEQLRQEQLKQEQLRQEQLRRLQHQPQHRNQRTPPPRMLPTSQSPRFLERQQRQIMLLQQQQQEIQQQQRLRELQEQLHMEELQRQLRAQQLSQARQQSPNQFGGHQRQTSGPTLAELQAAQLLHQQRLQSHDSHLQTSPHQTSPQSMPFHPQNVQLQQRLLAEIAQGEHSRDLQAISHLDHDALRTEAMRKILEAERMEEKRRRKAAKIAHMARYNDLMTQSDKDFITRIQVSQLVTQDPYAEDFYAQVYGAIIRSRLGLQSQDERVLKFGSSGGVGLGPGQKGTYRRPNAMQRMEAQVERIVSNARLREKEKSVHSLQSLQGVLGKTSGRSYKAAPRQLLQVDASTSPVPGHASISKEDTGSKASSGAALEAAKLGRETLGQAVDTEGLVRKDPLSHREVLSILEGLYDMVLKVEQLRRDQPQEEYEEAYQAWEHAYVNLVQDTWDGLRVMVPLETSNPHPFISLLTLAKGKKLLPRLTRHFQPQQMLTLLTLLVACFNQLDVVQRAFVLDSLEESPERNDLERQTQAFLGSVLQSILPVVAKAGLRLVSGLLGLLLDRSNIVTVAKARPGVALLTLFLSRVESIKQSISAGNDLSVSELLSADDVGQWQIMLDHLFELLTPHFFDLFPSVRLSIPPRTKTTTMDQPVWQFLAALALHASPEQQQILVASVREKVLENVLLATKGWDGDGVVEEGEREERLNNVNLFLHALGLDSSQITL